MQKKDILWASLGRIFFSFFFELFKITSVTVRLFGMKLASIVPRKPQKSTSITLPADGSSLKVLGGGELARFHFPD